MSYQLASAHQPIFSYAMVWISVFFLKPFQAESHVCPFSYELGRSSISMYPTSWRKAARTTTHAMISKSQDSWLQLCHLWVDLTKRPSRQTYLLMNTWWMGHFTLKIVLRSLTEWNIARQVCHLSSTILRSFRVWSTLRLARFSKGNLNLSFLWKTWFSQ